MSGWEQRPQSEIQMGNGSLLATFNSHGDIDQLFAPHLDALQSRLGNFQSSVLIPGGEIGGFSPQLIRVGSDAFQIRLQLAHGSQILQAEYHHRSGPLKIHRKIGLHPTEPLILDHWKFQDQKAGLLHESIPWMGYSTSSHCSLYHPVFNGLVHHRGRRWLGIMVRGSTEWVRVGHLSEHDRYRLWGGERVDAPIQSADLAGYPGGPVKLGWDQVVQGPATWGAVAVGPASQFEIAVICGESETHLKRLLQLVEQVPLERYFEMIDGMVVRRHQPAIPVLDKIKSPRVRALCERSIDVLHSLQDSGTGALVAAAEVDPHSKMSGGYGYSWPRDGAYLAWALGEFGFRERIEHYFKFLAETQDESGAWWQRYLATGHAGPSWGRIQIDEPATVIVCAYLHYKKNQDLFWLEKFWPTLQKGLSFLEGFHHADHLLGLPSHDLWEERMGIHAYSLGAVAAAFFTGAYLARELSNRELQSRYHQKSRELLKALKAKFVHEKEGVRRSFVVNSYDYPRGGGYWDETVDASLLGLVTPFGIFGKGDASTQRILQGVRSRLWCRPTGGILRYERDTYRGGNPWILTTLWLASVELKLGNYSDARESFQWALSKTTGLGMFPEQVHRETGYPFWVIPLGWSHAMFLLFVKEVVDRNVQGEIWDTGI